MPYRRQLLTYENYLYNFNVYIIKFKMFEFEDLPTIHVTKPRHIIDTTLAANKPSIFNAHQKVT